MIRKLLAVVSFCLFAFSPIPACAQNNSVVTSYNGYSLADSYPADPVSEAKFKNVDPKIIDELVGINKYVNGAIEYEYDEDHYGMTDFFVQDPADHKGDCEDYALTKMSLISMAQDRGDLDTIEGLREVKLVSVLVYYDDYDGKGIQEDGHMILAVRLPDHSVAYLDLLHDELMTRKELTHWQRSPSGGEVDRYEFLDWVG
jgi:predicted transglutaminase-like cysteine proteinase